MKNDIEKLLKDTGYCVNNEIKNALLVAEACDKPLLIEGAPGAGKTSLAVALANALNLPLIRVQLYEGLTDDKILYDYNYQKQLLTLEAIKPMLQEEYKDKNINDVIHKVASELDFYGKDFMIERPVLRAINGDGRKVLLFDEIDKAPEEIEYMLYEFLENYSITIPQYGKVTCPEDQRPIVFLTSNNYRELSQALKRRCVYLYMKPKTKEEMVDILIAKTEVDKNIAEGIARCMVAAQNMEMRQHPSIAEGVDLANYLKYIDNMSEENVLSGIGLIVKNDKDKTVMEAIIKQNIGLFKK